MTLQGKGNRTMDTPETKSAMNRPRRKRWRRIGVVAGCYLVLWTSTAVYGCRDVKNWLKPAQRDSPIKVTVSNPDIATTMDYNNNMTMNYVTTASPAPFIIIATFHDVKMHFDAVQGSTSNTGKRNQWCWWLFGLHGQF